LDGVKLTLDRAEAIFITAERVVVSLKGGELYVLSLLVDGMRSVRGLHFDRAAASVLTTSLTVLQERYLFLGSRLGNSLLLQFTEKDIGTIFSSQSEVSHKLHNVFQTTGSLSGTLLKLDEPPIKKKRLDDWMASDVIDIQEDDLEVYGQESTSSSSRIGSYSFEVCDSLLNIGPCGNVSMGEPAFLSEEFAAAVKADPDVELVTTSGHGKNGALCVLQQSVRPQVNAAIDYSHLQVPYKDSEYSRL
jgi:cleavage and polyadenylation specificity factor subunit 1